jgi:hypothetical protein
VAKLLDACGLRASSQREPSLHDRVVLRAGVAAPKVNRSTARPVPWSDGSLDWQ